MQDALQSRVYPRWDRGFGDYRLYLSPTRWVEEVFMNLDGTWCAGREAEGTVRVFDELSEALAYAIFSKIL